MEDDRPKIDFENAPYTYKPVEPNFVSGEELDAEGEYKSRALTRTGPPMRPLNARRSKPTDAKFQQWATEERELVLKAQQGDHRSASLLVERHLYGIQVKGWRRWAKLNGIFKKGVTGPPKRERAVEYGDFIGAAVEKFWLALTRFKSKRNNGLNAYTQWGVRGAISDMARDWRNRTAFGGMESDIQRFLRYGERWNWPAEIIKLKFPKFSIEEIEWEKEVVYAIQEGESYGEGGVDDEKAFDSDHGRQLETATDSLAAVQSLPMSQYSRGAALGVRWKKALRNVIPWHLGYTKGFEPKRRSCYAPLWNDVVERDYAERDSALLKRIGRQRYADLLVARSKRTDTVYQVRNGELVTVQADKGAVTLRKRTGIDVEANPPQHTLPPIPGTLRSPLAKCSSRKNKTLPLPIGQAPAVISYWNVLSKNRPRRGFDMQTTDEIVLRLEAALTKHRGHTPSDLATLAKTHTERISHGSHDAARGNVLVARKRA